MPKSQKRVPQPGDEDYSVPFDDAAENWMSDYRLEQLQAKGWTGSVAEYIAEWERLNADPLEQTPPVTAPSAA